MANIRQATLTLRVDSLQAYRDLQRFVKATNDVHVATTRTTSTLDKLQRQLYRLISAYAGFSVVRQSIRDFADFEKQLALVNTMLYQGNSHFLPQYAKQLRALSIQMGEDTSTLAKGLYDVLSATIPAAEAMKLLETTSKAAVGGMTTTATATDAVISVLKSYGLGTEYAAKVSSDLFEVVQRGEITFEELAHNIGHVAPIAAQAGVSLEELLAFIATTTRAGLRAELAVTAVKNAISEFIKPSREGAALAKELGFSLESATLQSMGLRGVFEMLRNQSPEVLATLFADIRGVNAVMATLGQYEDFLFDFGHIHTTSMAHLDAYSKMADTTVMKFQRFWMAIKALRTALGEVLAPVVADVAAQITDWVSKDPERFRQYGELLSVEIGRWKEIFFAFAEYLKNDFSGAASVAMDLFVTALELAGRQAIELAVRTGKGIGQAVKQGAMGGEPSMDQIEDRAIQLYNERHNLRTGTPRVTTSRGDKRARMEFREILKTEPGEGPGIGLIEDMLRYTAMEAMGDAEAQLREEYGAAGVAKKAMEGFGSGFKDQWIAAADAVKGQWNTSTAGRSFGDQVDQINAQYDARRQAALQKIRGERAQKTLQSELYRIFGKPLEGPVGWVKDRFAEGRQYQIENNLTFGKKVSGQMTQDQIDQMRAKSALEKEVHQYVEAVEFETKALMMNRQEAEKATEVFRFQQRAKEDGIELEKQFTDQIEKQIETFQRAQKLRNIGDEIGQGFSRGFADAAYNARDLGDALRYLENAAVGVMQRVMDIMLWEPMAQNMSTSFMHWMSPTTPNAGNTKGYHQFARGGRFRGGRVIPFAVGGIVSRPTMFPLSNGTGLAGENGPEWAIAPLKRMPSGNLGVETTGNKPSLSAQIHLHNESGVPLDAQVSEMRFDAGRAVLGVMLKDRRNNGPVHRANRRR